LSAGLQKVAAGPSARQVSARDVSLASSARLVEDSGFMRLMPLLVACLLAAAERPAHAGAGCRDVCDAESIGRPTCDALRLGCNPRTGQCAPCEHDGFCRPGGLCVNGQCLNVNCSAIPDAGPGQRDAAPDADAQAADGGALVDGGAAPLDGAVDASEPDAGAIDAGAVSPTDAAAPDAVAAGPGVTPAFCGSRCGEKAPYEPDCSCRSTAPAPLGPWAAALGALLFLRRRRR
jgi:MYXO-CTERM domain-containing protein